MNTARGSAARLPKPLQTGYLDPLLARFSSEDSSCDTFHDPEPLEVIGLYLGYRKRERKDDRRKTKSILR